MAEYMARQAKVMERIARAKGIEVIDACIMFGGAYRAKHPRGDVR